MPFACLHACMPFFSEISRVTVVLDVTIPSDRVFTNECTRYGQPLGIVGGLEMFSFPSVERLAAIDPDELRQLGFG